MKSCFCLPSEKQQFDYDNNNGIVILIVFFHSFKSCIQTATDLCEKNQVWTTGWRQFRAQSVAEFREAVAQAAALHAHDELFSKHIEPGPAPEDPVDWVMAEASDDEDDAPMPDAPPELELIDMPPTPASALPMSNLERCIALCLVYGAGPR